MRRCGAGARVRPVPVHERRARDRRALGCRASPRELCDLPADACVALEFSEVFMKLVASLPDSLTVLPVQGVPASSSSHALGGGAMRRTTLE